MKFQTVVLIVLLLYFGLFKNDCCRIPSLIQDTWYSIESGKHTEITFEKDFMSDRGFCMDVVTYNKDNFTFLFKNNDCYYCVRIFLRTVNVLQRIETSCVSLKTGAASIESICRELDPDQQLITMFLKHHAPKNCRSSLEGVWHFAYQRRDMFTGECSNPEANITACQAPGSQFTILNEQFIINYKKCDGMEKTIDADVYYTCLGDWFIGKNHYFAAVNSKESRLEERYRCFLKNRDDDLYLGVSITPDCSVLKTPQESPERLHLTPVKAEIVIPGCHFPQNFSGAWINTANLDAEVVINATHIVETWHPDSQRFRRHVYVCQEQRGTRYMLARLGVDGCQKDYLCYEFLPRHHNIIRFRKGVAFWKKMFHTVCSWVSFSNTKDWLYSFLILKDPTPIRCPVAGKFRFTQKGDYPFETRIRGGITQSPRPNVDCKENISDFSACGINARQINIDADYCLSVDYLGRPDDIYSEPDNIMKCIGFWKENLISYLITMDEEDALSQFRCWVYQRTDLNSIQMSYSVGDFCNLNQRVTSWNYTEGALVSIHLVEYERERDNCPMYFDDGSNPWKTSRDEVSVLHFYHDSSPVCKNNFYVLGILFWIMFIYF